MIVQAARALAAEHGMPLLNGALAILSGEPRPVLSADATTALRALDGAGAAPAFPLTGADLIGAGVPPGPAVGRGLAAARSLWLERGCPAGPEARAALVARALESARRP